MLILRSLAARLLLRSAVIKVSGPAACLGGTPLANSATQQLSDMPAVGCNLCGYPLQFHVRNYLLCILLRAAAIKRNAFAASFNGTPLNVFKTINCSRATASTNIADGLDSDGRGGQRLCGRTIEGRGGQYSCSRSVVGSAVGCYTSRLLSVWLVVIGQAT